MLNFAAALLLIFAAVPVAADPVEEVRQAEISFARAFAERNSDAFFAQVLDDATFMGALNTTGGKQAVFDSWSRFFKLPAAPFSWGPERVVVNAAGTVGLSTGPVYDAKGNHVANYSSIWLKQPDGKWKILFDGPGSQAASFAADAITIEEGFVTTPDGAKLHYRKAGGPSPIVLIVPMEFAIFDDFKQLADIATVIAYDPRGRGRSSRPDVSTATIQHDVEDLEAVRAHFKIERFVPVGYSYFGLAVAMYALDHPDRVARMIQLGPAPMRAAAKYSAALQHGVEDLGVAPEDMKRWQDARAAGLAAKSPREFCEMQGKVFRYLLVGNAANADRVHVDCSLENEWPVKFDRQYAVTRASLDKLALAADDFRRIAAPTLVIHGDKDRNAPYGSGREWALTLPNARLVTVKGGAHQSWADDPVTVFGAIRAFLRRDVPLGSEKVTKLEP